MGKTQLEGQRVPLKRPIAVMTLQKPDDGSREYHAVGIVRTKLVFKTRPVPLARSEPMTMPGNSKRVRVGTPDAL